MTPFPIPAPAFKGESRAVSADNAFGWLNYGWALFLASPSLWLALAGVVLVGMLVLGFVPWIGHPLASFLVPLLAIGLLHVCRKIADDQPAQFSDMWVAFRRSEDLHKRWALAVFYMLATWIVFQTVTFFGWGRLAAYGDYGPVGSSPGLGTALAGVLLAMLILLAFSVPLFMAMWFAPALVYFNRMPVPEALKASFEACLKNGLPLAAFGLVVMVLAVFSVLSAGLGLLVLIPVLAGANHASYRDVFVAN